MEYRRVALISDIHGNFAGLQAVWRDIEACECDRVICLGDLVDGGDENVETVRFVRERGIPCVRGNHDESHTLVLPDDVSHYLENLPKRLDIDGVLYTHISPRARERKIIDEYEAWNVFDECDARLIVVGHAHIPMIYGERNDQAATATYYPAVHNVPFPLDPSDRYIICVGAIGYPRDGIRFPRYAIYDPLNHTVEARIVAGPVLPFG